VHACCRDRHRVGTEGTRRAVNRANASATARETVEKAKHPTSLCRRPPSATR
jgi:hypothetical protein